MGIPGADFGVYIGVNFGGLFGAFLRSCLMEFYIEIIIHPFLHQYENAGMVLESQYICFSTQGKCSEPIIYDFLYKIMPDTCRYILYIPSHTLIFSCSTLLKPLLVRILKLGSDQYG